MARGWHRFCEARMMTDFLQHKVSRSFAQSFTEFFCGLLKNLALFVFFYTEIHRIFFWFWLRWLETHRDILLFSFANLAKKLCALCVKIYTELHRAFLILIALKRVTPRRFTFFLALFAKNLCFFAFKFTQSYTEFFFWFWLRWKELHRDASLSSWRALRKTFASLRLNLHITWIWTCPWFLPL